SRPLSDRQAPAGREVRAAAARRSQPEAWRPVPHGAEQLARRGDASRPGTLPFVCLRRLFATVRAERVRRPHHVDRRRVASSPPDVAPARPPRPPPPPPTPRRPPP